MNSWSCDQDLARLWDRCAESNATEGDWKALYQFVVGLLMRCRAPELEGLPDARRTYVDRYFTDKVFLAMRRGVRPFHCGAVVLFFRRYLRTELLGLKSSATLDGQTDEEDERDSGIQLEASEEFRDLDQVLREGCGKSVAEVARSAEQFLADLRQEEEWAWLMLVDGFFADDNERIPLSVLAKRHQIPSWHYRATKLGIIHRDREYAATYRNTMLGKWLEQALGRPVSDEIGDSVDAAFQILGFQALRG